MFYEICGVEMSGNKTQRTQKLCAVKPLENGAAFEVINGIEIWHPVWDARVDHIVNAQFLKSVVERIWNNEKVAESVAMEMHTHPSSCRLFATPKGKVN
jgi:hypothetical protein